MNSDEPETTRRSSSPNRDDDTRRLAFTHYRWGWVQLLVFLILGSVLETLHGFKAELYLDVSNSTRRLMWSLAHAHGAALAVIHWGFGASLQYVPRWTGRGRLLASRSLSAASVLFPGGFFLGGVFIHAGDPGLGIFLVPVGAAMLATSVLLTMLQFFRAAKPPATEASRSTSPSNTRTPAHTA